MARDLGNVLVTGADGFIGSHLVERLVERGEKVTALCLYNSNGHHGWLEPIANAPPKNLRVALGDVRDPFFVDDLVRGHDTVLHLAALIAIPYSYDAPESYVATNINGTLNVAKACLTHGTKRLVHTSTSEVYGTARFVPITESHPLQPQSPYSATKIAADMVVESFYRSFGLPAVTLRPFNTYGPRQSLRAVLPTIAAQLLAGRTSLLLGNLTPTRDFNFVSDTVEAFLAIAEADDSVHGDVFQTGTGVEVSVRDAALAIAKEIGVEVTFEVEADRQRPALSEVERLLSDATKLRRKTGWSPKVDFAAGVAALVAWLRGRSDLARAATYQK
ncbi:MAG: SDR family NAD(P)-dependent oxidoreductase [Labilithrix sp.]|nr:SDR family NAD(P)-dependent oxidoreductase [Labilithrix sp.]MCW5814768.1 SDR family NAD(P)-dependent oxidoreductase [Labilithrix sp.]